MHIWRQVPNNQSETKLSTNLYSTLPRTKCGSPPKALPHLRKQLKKNQDNTLKSKASVCFGKDSFSVSISLFDFLIFVIVVIWHSDKPLYQKQCGEKIATIMSCLSSSVHKMQWFDQFLYIFNSHWDKVDNFRIDKYLMFLRFMFNQAIQFLKSKNYDAKYMKWYQKSIYKIYKD